MLLVNGEAVWELWGHTVLEEFALPWRSRFVIWGCYWILACSWRLKSAPWHIVPFISSGWFSVPPMHDPSRLNGCNVSYTGLPLKAVWKLQLDQNMAVRLLVTVIVSPLCWRSCYPAQFIVWILNPEGPQWLQARVPEGRSLSSPQGLHLLQSESYRYPSDFMEWWFPVLETIANINYLYKPSLGLDEENLNFK